MPAARNAHATAQPPGRPRSPSADRAILDAAVRLLSQEGYAHLSVERIAAEARVGKATVYRRYRDRQELAAAAAAHIAAHRPFDAFERVDARTGLSEVLAHVHGAVGSAPVLSMLGTLMSEQPYAPAHMERFWAHVLAPHQAATRSVIDLGVRRDQVRPDTTADVVAEVLLGAFLARALSGLDVTPEWIESVVTLLWHGVGRDGGEGRAESAGRAGE